MTLEQRLEQAQEALERATVGGPTVAPAYLSLAMTQLLEVVRELSAEGKARHEQR